MTRAGSRPLWPVTTGTWSRSCRCSRDARADGPDPPDAPRCGLVVFGVHSERGLMSLEDMLRAEAEHIPHHLDFLVEKRKALGLAPVPA